MTMLAELNKIKSEVERLRTRQGRGLMRGVVTQLTSSETIAVTNTFHKLDPDGGTQNLTTITGGKDGRLLILRVFEVGDSVTVKANTGNIFMTSDVVLNSPSLTLFLIYDDEEGGWLAINGAGSGGGGGSTEINAAIAAHAALPNIHHSRLHDVEGVLDHSVVGAQYSVLGLSATDTLDVLATTTNGNTNPNTILRAGATGDLTLNILSTNILTSPGILTLNPTGRVSVQAGVDFRTTDSVTGFLGSGWRLENQSGFSFLDIRRIQVEELHAYAFVADIERVRVGETFTTPSMGLLNADVVIPAVDASTSITIEDVPQFPGAVFIDNEIVMMEVVDRSGGGLTIARAWGQVSGYTDNGNGTQTWTYTHRFDAGPVGMTFKKGSLVLDFGMSGDGYIHESVIDAGGSPYLRMATWTTNPWTPANRHIKVQLGNLDSITDINLNPTGFGLYGTNVFLDGRIIIRSGSSGIGQLSDANLDNIANGSTYGRVAVTDITAGHIRLDATVDGTYGKVLSVILDAGYIQVGSGVKDSTLSGWNLQETEIVGQLSGVDQVVMGTDGRIKAGQSSIMLGYYGLDIVAYSGTNPNPTDNVKAVAFWDALSSANGSNRPAGRLWGAYNVSNQYGWQMEAFHSSHTSDYPKMWMIINSLSSQRNFTVTDTDVISLGGTDIFLLGATHISGQLTMSNHVVPDTSVTYDLGTASVYWRKLYVDEIIAGTITGGTGLTGQIWQYDTGDMYIRSNSTSTHTLYVANPNTGSMHLDVEGNIIVGGLVDGVDVGNLNATFATHLANPDAHHAQVHVLATTSALGPDHTVSGLTAGQVLKATGATTALFVQLSHSELGNLDADDHTQYFDTTRGDARYVKLAGSTMTGKLIISTGATSNLNLTNSSVTPYPFELTRSDLSNTTRLRNGGGFIEFENSPKVGANLIWHAGNDGAGSGLDADTIDTIESAQIVVTNTSRVITVQHSFSPGVVQAPFILGGNAFDQVVTGLMADTLNKSVLTDSTLTGGGALTASRTLGVNLANAFAWTATHTWTTGDIDMTAGDIRANGTAWLMNNRKVKATSGTVSLPSYTFSTDATTGMYLGGAGIIAFTASGTDVLQVTSSRLNPASTGTIDIGDYNRKFRTLFVTELYAETLVAQAVMATIGGRITVAPTNELIAAVPKTIAYIDVKYNNLGNADFVYFEAAPNGVPQIEAMKVVSTASTITGGYRYTVLRAVNNGVITTLIATLNSENWIQVANNNLNNGDTIYITNGTDSEIMTVTSDSAVISGGYLYLVTRSVNGFSITGMTAGTPIYRITRAWEKGDALINLDQDLGSGYIDITSTSTILNHLGPTIAIYSRTSTSVWNGLVPTVALGNLRSFVDYSTDTFGWAVGNNLTLTATSGFRGLTADYTNGLRLFNVTFKQYNGSTEFMRLDTQGMALLSDVTPTTQNSIVWYTGSIGSDLLSSSSIGYLTGYRTTNFNLITLTALAHVGKTKLSLLALNESGSATSIEISGQSSTYTQTSAIRYIANTHSMYSTASGGPGIIVGPTAIALGITADLTPSNGIYVTTAWIGLPDADFSEISNDRGTYKQLMLVGNSSVGGGVRQVGVWDKLQVGGSAFYQTFNVNGSAYISGNLVIGATTPAYIVDIIAAAGTQSILRVGQTGVSNGFTITTNGSVLTYTLADGPVTVGQDLIVSGKLTGGWTALTYTNAGGTTWADFGSGFQAGKYKKFGDIVFVRGLCKRTAGTGTTIATLPSGYRPAATELTIQMSDAGAARVDVDTGGNIIIQSGGTAALPLNIIFSTL